MDVPLEALVSGKRLEIARMQDRLIDLIYNYIQPDAILYGGTAIWRCLGGSRFSEDIDIYVNPEFNRKIDNVLRRSNLKIENRDRELPLHMSIGDGKTAILLEASEGSYESTIAQYTRTDGTSMTISMLPPSELFIRKMEAYEGRRYIRDIYDLVHLTNFVDKSDSYIRSEFRLFIEGIKKPVDEHILRSLVYRGSSMPFDKMVAYLRTWSDEV